MYCTNWKIDVFLIGLLLTRAVAECCTGKFRTNAFAPSGAAFPARLACSRRAAWEGGMESYSRCLRANMCSVASSTPVAALVIHENNKPINVFRSVFLTSVWNWLRLLNVSVTSSNTSHVCQADFFPFHLKADTTSHPVKPGNT